MGAIEAKMTKQKANWGPGAIQRKQSVKVGRKTTVDAEKSAWMQQSRGGGEQTGASHKKGQAKAGEKPVLELGWGPADA